MTFIVNATDRCTIPESRRSPAVTCIGETMELRGGILGAPDTIYLDGKVAFQKVNTDNVPGIADGHWECRAPWIDPLATDYSAFRYTHLEFGWTPAQTPDGAGVKPPRRRAKA